ncbi:MAG: hydantoinase B/oxoprolinase family protein, partial [Mesorhizobium sp.]
MTEQRSAMKKATQAMSADVDPITTEIIRHTLNSVAEQMKRTLIRTAFSPVIYEVLDFAVSIYDRQVRLLAQAPTLPIFMGTLSFCVEAAVKGVGGEKALE